MGIQYFNHGKYRLRRHPPLIECPSIITYDTVEDGLNKKSHLLFSKSYFYTRPNTCSNLKILILRMLTTLDARWPKIMKRAFSLNNFFFFFLLFDAGLIFDMTGSFAVSFTLLSAVSLLTAVSLGIEDICMGCSHKSADL